MSQASGRIGRWWAALQGPPPVRVPFAVVCTCGALLRGARRARAQVVRCTACRQGIFILPESPLTPPGQGETIAGSGPSRRCGLLTRWRLPVLAAVGTLTLVLIVLSAVIWQLKPSTVRNTSRARQTVPRLEMEARQALHQGDFARAAECFTQASDIAYRHADEFPPAARREFARLQRQVDMLKDVPADESLAQKLDAWNRLSEGDLKVQLDYYRNRPFLFDLRDVTRDLSGQYTYQNNLGQPLPGLHLETLDLLRKLPLDREPRRLIFAARLANVTRPDGRAWHVTLVPESGLFLTDLDVASACRLPVATDPELRTVLEWQAGLEEEKR